MTTANSYQPRFFPPITFTILVGHSQSDVQEAVLQVKEDLEGDQENFYILILHDYDLDGVRIYFTLKQRYNAVIDVGVNGEFLQWIKKHGDSDARLTEEKLLNKKFRRNLRDCMINSSEYTEADFDYLQGKPFEVVERGKPKTHWEGKRIEIDAIHAQYGIKPFIDYILYKISKDCRIWDLGRIGVEPWDLDEPDNRYQIAISKFGDKISREYGKKSTQLRQPRDNILDLVEDALPTDTEFLDLKSKYQVTLGKKYNVHSEGVWQYSYEPALLKSDELDKLRNNYEDQIRKHWTNDYQDRLNEINGNITFYEGDVREGEADLERQIEELQEELDDVTRNDPSLEPFIDRLQEIEWGKDELEEISPPDETDLIRQAIQALLERLVELEEIN